MVLRRGFEPATGMNQMDAAAVVAACAGIVGLLLLSSPRDGLVYLLAFPIWLIGRDLGLRSGIGAGLIAVAFVALGAAQGVSLGPIGYVGCTLVFLGTGAAGASASAIPPR